MKKVFIVICIIVVSYWIFIKNDSVKVVVNGQEFTYEYIEKVKKGRSGSTLPLIIALHGNGDTASSFYSSLLEPFNFSESRIILIKAPIPYRSLFHITGASWPVESFWIKKYGDGLHKAIKLIIRKIGIMGKPIIFGFSGGAMMTYYLAANYPDSYSYFVPVSGRLPSDLFPGCEEDVEDDLFEEEFARVNSYHGIDDQVISISSGRGAVKQLQKCVSAKLTEFKCGHVDIFYRKNRPILNLLKELSESL